MPPIRRSKPTYALDDVQRLISGAVIGHQVVKKTRQDCALEFERDVKIFIRQCVNAITSKNFAYAELQDYDSWSIFADIYGFKDENGTWFIKFYIKDEQLYICSCHESDRDMTLANGRILRAP